MADNIFRCNSLYDPDYTGAGHQPYGFDQIMDMYEHFTVIASKITVNIVGNQSSLPFWVGIALRPDNTSLTGVATQVLREQPDIKWRLMSGNLSNPPETLSLGFSAKKYFGKRAIVGDTLYRGNATSNPTEGAFFHVLIAPQNTSDDIQTQLVNIKINYVAVFTEPNILVSS